MLVTIEGVLVEVVEKLRATICLACPVLLENSTTRFDPKIILITWSKNSKRRMDIIEHDTCLMIDDIREVVNNRIIF